VRRKAMPAEKKRLLQININHADRNTGRFKSHAMSPNSEKGAKSPQDTERNGGMQRAVKKKRPNAEKRRGRGEAIALRCGTGAQLEIGRTENYSQKKEGGQLLESKGPSWDHMAVRRRMGPQGIPWP